MFFRKGIPLLLLPRNRKACAETIRLYRPQTVKAKVATWGLRLLNQLGGIGLLPGIDGKGDNQTGVLFCNPCHGTRILALKRMPTGSRIILKAALSRNAAPLLSEHKALILRKGTTGVPPVGSLERRDDAVWFSMPYLETAQKAVNPISLLHAWETDIRECATKNGLVRDLLPLLDEPTRVTLAGKSVRRALVHGDFAPWNWRTDGNGRLVCIDWEWAREDGFAGFDLVYCLVQQALLVKRVSEKRLMPFLQRAMSRLSPEGQACLQEAGLPLDLLVHLVLAYRRSKGMDNPSHDGGTPPSKPGRAATGGRCPPVAALPRFLAIEGADGVGKSTVLRLLIPELVKRGEYNGYLFFHWKPVKRNLSYDSIPGDTPHDPRGKKPRNPLASLVFLAHHWLDFQLGYWRFVRPAIRNGRLVVADRYTYDVLLDPKRFRLKLPAWILRLFVRMIPRPDRAILLHAEPAVIRTRKPELSKEEIATYQASLLGCLDIRGSLLVDAGRRPEEIVEAIIGCR